MHKRDRTSAPGRAQRRGAAPELDLLSAIGNRGMTQLLARDKKGSKGSKGDKNQASFAHGVRVGKHAAVEITGGNIGPWVNKENPDSLDVECATGKHSAELKRVANGKERIDTIVTESIVGENTLVTITFKGALIRDYTAADGKETWKIVHWEGANRHSVGIGAARPDRK
jgi:hypothetical protein